MSSPAGWYPDPGGRPDTYRYWDGRAWSAAITKNPAAPAPTPSLGSTPVAAGSPRPGPGSYGQGSYGQGVYGQGVSGQGSYGQGSYGQGSYGQGVSGHTPGQGAGASTYGQGPVAPEYGPQSAYAQFQQTAGRRTGRGWWIGGAAVLVVIAIVVVFAVRALTGANGPLAGTNPGGQGSQDPCPTQNASASPEAHPNDGRVHGGPISYPALGSPWSGPGTDTRVAFGSDVAVQEVPVQTNYNGKGDSWVASILVARLQAGDGFFTPQQGSQIVVKCIIGAFYGDAVVNSDVKKNQAATIDGHQGWLVESHLTFDIAGLDTKGELLIVAIVKVSETSSGIFYASIPDTTPELVQPAREALQQVQVDS